VNFGKTQNIQPIRCHEFSKSNQILWLGFSSDVEVSPLKPLKLLFQENLKKISGKLYFNIIKQTRKAYKTEKFDFSEVKLSVLSLTFFKGHHLN
jgi:hypothetical protein